MPGVLSEKQQLIYDYVRHCCLDGIAPTGPEVSAQFGMPHKQSAESILRALQRKGWITMAPGKERSIRLTGLTLDVDRRGDIVTVATGGRVAMARAAWIDWLKQELALTEGKL